MQEKLKYSTIFCTASPLFLDSSGEKHYWCNNSEMENIEFHVIPPPRGSAGNNKARESVIKKTGLRIRMNLIRIRPVKKRLVPSIKKNWTLTRTSRDNPDSYLIKLNSSLIFFNKNRISIQNSVFITLVNIYGRKTLI